MEEQKIMGMAFPITNSMIDNLKKKQPLVICKFTSQEVAPKYLRVGMKIFFYLSKKIIGDANIKEIQVIFPSKILKDYKEKLLAPIEDFKNYIKDRQNKKMLTIKLNKINLYKKGKEPIYPIPMSGRYIKENECRILKI